MKLLRARHCLYCLLIPLRCSVVRGFACFPLALGLAVGVASAHAQTLQNPQIEVLGRPWSQRFQGEDLLYARNIWDLRWFQNRLYIGGGNSSNKGPASNAGPVPLIAFDPALNQWVQEGRVDEEQIDNFALLDGDLVIPGHDPRQNWDWGNFYIRGAQDKWAKHRNIPAALHTYDMVSYGGRWFAALGTAKGGAIAMSVDQGASWETVLITSTRVARFMVVNEQLIAMPVWGSRSGRSQDKPLQWRNGIWQNVPDSGALRWFPATQLAAGQAIKVHSALSVASGALYIGAYTHNDHQSRPFGLYFGSLDTKGSWNAQTVPLPAGWEPWDLVENGEMLYLLLNRPGVDRSQVQIWRASRDAPTKWSPRLSLEVPAFARSLEVREGEFYLGIGSEAHALEGRQVPVLHPDTGLVLRVRTHKGCGNSQCTVSGGTDGRIASLPFAYVASHTALRVPSTASRQHRHKRYLSYFRTP